MRLAPSYCPHLRLAIHHLGQVAFARERNGHADEAAAIGSVMGLCNLVQIDVHGDSIAPDRHRNEIALLQTLLDG